MSTATLITAEEFSRMSFDMPCELVRGEIVEMTSPGHRHGVICHNISRAMVKWLNDEDAYSIASNDSGIQTESDPDTVRGPDVQLVSRDRLPDRMGPVGHLEIPADLAIEVMSPSDRWPRIIQKVGEYLAAGVREVWVLDPDHQRVHVYRLDDEPTVLDSDRELISTAISGLRFPVSELFRGV